MLAPNRLSGGAWSDEHNWGSALRRRCICAQRSSTRLARSCLDGATASRCADGPGQRSRNWGFTEGARRAGERSRRGAARAEEEPASPRPVGVAGSKECELGRHTYRVHYFVLMTGQRRPERGRQMRGAYDEGSSAAVHQHPGDADAHLAGVLRGRGTPTPSSVISA